MRGAFQALAWARMILSSVKDIAQLEKTLTEIDKALDNIRTKAAKEFTSDIQAELKAPESS